MKLKNKNLYYLILSLVVLVGFMIKLPRPLHKFDKELHLAFYFFSMLFLWWTWGKWSFNKILLCGMALSAFGFFIEAFQQYSNRFFKKRIHGNFDWEDILANTTGIFLFLFCWLIVKAIRYFFGLVRRNN
jgi:hypothetical protein